MLCLVPNMDAPAVLSQTITVCSSSRPAPANGLLWTPVCVLIPSITAEDPAVLTGRGGGQGNRAQCVGTGPALSNEFWRRAAEGTVRTVAVGALPGVRAAQ